MDSQVLLTLLSVLVIAAPAVLLSVLGLGLLLEARMAERTISAIVQMSVIVGLLSAVGILAGMLWLGTRHVELELGNWVVLPIEHFHFHFKIIFDRLSIPMVILSFALCGTVGAFGHFYLHREPGFNRFFFFYSVFLMGMVVSSVAGTIETMFAGWELVGLSSALLVAFFHERPNPVRNGARVWSVYRVADAAFLIAAVVLHHLTGEGDFDALTGTQPWPLGEASLTAGQAALVGGLLLVAAAGKSALIPFSGWLPRAMEGPTPSSAIFYGALSVHLGAFLMLRVSPILEQSVPLCVALVVLGASTSIFASMASRVQTDIKSSLAFASLTQVGIIFAEIGLGMRYIPLAHMIGHACLRTLQLLRAPNLLNDYRTLENAIGARLDSGGSFWRRWIPLGIQQRAYRFAFHRGYLDAILDGYIVIPITRTFQVCDALERRWATFLSGKRPEATSQVAPYSEAMDELG